MLELAALAGAPPPPRTCSKASPCYWPPPNPRSRAEGSTAISLLRPWLTALPEHPVAGRLALLAAVALVTLAAYLAIDRPAERLRAAVISRLNRPRPAAEDPAAIRFSSEPPAGPVRA